MTEPTLLLIDVGNSRIKYWLHHATRHPLTGDSEIPAIAHDGTFVPDALRALWLDAADAYAPPDEIRISHVAHADLYEQLRGLCAQLWPHAPIRRIRARAHHPHLQLGYDDQQMGSDRYAQILGAQRLCPNDAHIVISAGTALTIDGVQAGGKHIGGVICAGLQLMRTALHQYTAQLPLDGGEIHAQHAPHNTRDALASGVMLSSIGAITQFIQRYCSDDPRARPHLLFCGGDALRLLAHCQQMAELTDLPMRHAPALCLLGLLEM